MECSRIALGQGAISVSRVIAGMWRMADWGMDVQARAGLIEACMEMGVTTFDHADIYGDYTVESLFGEALHKLPGMRDKMEIISKCGIKLISDKRPAHNVNHYDTTAAHIQASVETSLKNLGTEYLDILLIHRPDPLMNYDEMAEAFTRLHTEGKVRHFGVSNFTAVQFAAMHKRFPLVTNQIELSPVNVEAIEHGLLDVMQDLAVPPMIWSALGGGQLFASDRQDTPLMRLLQTVAADLGVTVAMVIYAWLMKLPSRPIPLTGTGKVQGIRDAVAATRLDLDRMTWFRIYEAIRGHEVA
ncbi:aldo/keto reductase [Leeia oryzae]|uniref:aldo/keto reductase n=1 Tax=Leeia oryzae TaxID=356662 RepID=UPI00037DE116|nr:aldo/keto reductase [Leeia oryzae]